MAPAKPYMSIRAAPPKLIKDDPPHIIDRALKDRQNLRGTFGPDGSRTYYIPGRRLTVRHGYMEIESMTVCPKPTWMNSGAHRLFIEAMYRNQRFLVVTEEIEHAVDCRITTGLTFYVGAFTEEGRKLALQAGIDRIAFDIVNGGISFARGEDATFTTENLELKFFLVDPYTLLREGCTLSKEAQNCLITRPFYSPPKS